MQDLDERMPILVGCGDITDLDTPASQGRSPYDLIAQASRLALDDTGAAGIGTAIDTVYHLTGFISYNGMYPVVDFIAPIWISALWAGLAVTLDYSLKVLIGRPVWTFVIGAVFGPLAYWSGDSIGAVHFTYGPWESMAIMAVPWGLAFIACYWILEFWRPKEG